LELSNDRSYSAHVAKATAGLTVNLLFKDVSAKKDAHSMTTQSLTQISYSNAYNTVLSTGAVSGTHPIHGWAQIGRAVVAQTLHTLNSWGKVSRTTKAERRDAAVRASLLRKAAAVRATQPGLANELVVFATRDQ
jgi:hypothetical protein